MSKEKAIKALCGKVLNKEKYNYLTSDEANMSNERINLQISLGLQSCKTKKDVCDLLEDIRTHERQKCLLKIALAKKKIRELEDYKGFVEHIYSHRKEVMGLDVNTPIKDWVICKICKKTINQLKKGGLI